MYNDNIKYADFKLSITVANLTKSTTVITYLHNSPCMRKTQLYVHHLKVEQRLKLQLHLREIMSQYFPTKAPFQMGTRKKRGAAERGSRAANGHRAGG